MQVKVTVSNHGKRAVELNFPTDQRIEIYLRNWAEDIDQVVGEPRDYRKTGDHSNQP